VALILLDLEREPRDMEDQVCLQEVETLKKKKKIGVVNNNSIQILMEC
jgi:hypothetical protein